MKTIQFLIWPIFFLIQTAAYANININSSWQNFSSKKRSLDSIEASENSMDVMYSKGFPEAVSSSTKNKKLLCLYHYGYNVGGVHIYGTKGNA